jgi:predicted ATP-dependent endonuclease of OLD family
VAPSLLATPTNHKRLKSLNSFRVGLLLIDEPELGLHPQLQGYLLQELLDVSGDPMVEARKKLIIMATHSPALVPADTSEQLSAIYFCHSHDKPPSRLLNNRPLINRLNRRNMLTRLDWEKGAALFAKNVLLVEGKTDQIIARSIAKCLGLPMAIAGVEVVSATGKGELPILLELMYTIGKKVMILTDLDTIVDGSDLIDTLRLTYGADAEAQELGHRDAKDLYNNNRNDFCQYVDLSWEEIRPYAENDAYWSGRLQDDVNFANPQRDQVARRRASAVTLLTASDELLTKLGGRWLELRRRLDRLLKLFEGEGIFVLRSGCIERYYSD